MGFDRQDVQRWEEEKHKTEVVINKWAKTGEQSTIKALLDYFRQLHIYSLLRNSRLIEAIGEYSGKQCRIRVPLLLTLSRSFVASRWLCCECVLGCFRNILTQKKCECLICLWPVVLGV